MRTGLKILIREQELVTAQNKTSKKKIILAHSSSLCMNLFSYADFAVKNQFLLLFISMCTLMSKEL